MKNKSMRSFVLIGLYFVLSLKEVLTESENEIKRGVYPFMAIVYYPDEVMDPEGIRFSRNAVLIKPEWLVSSSMETNDVQLPFPRKTLVARVGAISFDANFTLNEDEDEQEREIIQIVRPTNFSASPWWYNDITILKTLLPFNMTSAVAWTTLAVKRDYLEKNCYILVFIKKYVNSSDEKFLMQFPVDLSTSSLENCGEHFRNETMICASDIDENRISVYDPEFCHGNAGGPLMCDGGIIGLQSYIGSNCKQPYLYQYLSAWDDFISCGAEEKCQMQECANICEVVNKDTMFITISTEKVDAPILTTKSNSENILEQSVEDVDEHLPLPEIIKEKVTTEVTENAPRVTTTSEAETTSTASSVAITENEDTSISTTGVDFKERWPKEKFVENRKKLDEAEDSDKIERNTNVEARHHEVKKRGRNAGERPITKIWDLFYSLSFGILLITYII